MLSFAFVYAASTIGLFFVVLTSVIVYLAAKKIEEVDDDRKKKVLIAAMGACLFILIFLKYLSGLSIFTQGNLMIFGNEMTIQGVIKKYLLPIGMSYYTLQVISYLLDVYWGRMDAEEDYWKVLLFTCYFPQLVQGPISKYSELAPELFKEHKLDWKNIKYGVQLMLWGFFKKMLIADRIGVYVNAIFHEGVTPYGLTAWIGLVFYGIQLYCDFSGGIDVIRGVSECFGIGLKENFRQPYFSLSLGEFWRRWHISLGTWMKDYIFYPVSMAGWMSALKKKLKKITSRKTATRVAILALGYYNDPERTEKSFIINPNYKGYPERMYRTGDYGRIREDGFLEFHGRMDRQVKHMGHRVELDEIEYAANQIAGVDECVSLYNKEKEVLYLFYSGETAMRQVVLELRKVLPGFMVPRKVKQVSALPKLASGKIDMTTLKEEM